MSVVSMMVIVANLAEASALPAAVLSVMWRTTRAAVAIRHFVPAVCNVWRVSVMAIVQMRHRPVSLGPVRSVSLLPTAGAMSKSTPFVSMVTMAGSVWPVQRIRIVTGPTVNVSIISVASVTQWTIRAVMGRHLSAKSKPMAPLSVWGA